jgi:hypothetical protein
LLKVVRLNSAFLLLRALWLLLCIAGSFISISNAETADAQVQGRVEWATSHKPVENGEIRIDGPKGHLSRFLHEGNFWFDFAAIQLSGGEFIHISIKDGSNQNLRVILPWEGDTFAPKPPISSLVWKVARRDEGIQASADLTGQYLAWEIVRQPPLEVASFCDPSPRLIASAASTFKIAPEKFEDYLQTWSMESSGPPIHWTPTADPQTRCRGWRSDQTFALRQKLRADSDLLGRVKDVTPPDQLQPLYMETAKTRTSLGAIYFEAKDYDAAQTYFQDASIEFDHAGPGSTEQKRQVKTLYDKARQAKAAGSGLPPTPSVASPF